MLSVYHPSGPAHAKAAQSVGRRPRSILILAFGVGLTLAAPAMLPIGPEGPSSSAFASPATVGLWTGDPVPSIPSTADQAEVELGMRFESDVDGSVAGVRFFMSADDSGPHVAQLWDSSGRSLAQAAFTGEAVPGWRTVLFEQPVRISAGRSYTASYHTSVGSYAVTSGGFEQPLRNGVLKSPPDAGVYRYGASGFPKQSYNSSNYWVDVQFVPDQPTSGTTAVASAGTRDKRSWPFSSTSIWNMPIGSAADYRPLGMTPPTSAFGTDEVFIALDPTAPLRNLVERGQAWPWGGLTGNSTGVNVHVPDNWIVPAPALGEFPNRASAALQADGTVREWQYTVRPAAGSAISMFGAPRANYSLTGDGLQGRQFGSHGGSGMIGLGGTIRSGELTGPAPIRHALALTMNMRKWGTQQGGNINNGFRWPAAAADSYYDEVGTGGGYGTLDRDGGQPKDGLGMGSLLAIPASVDLGALDFETAAGGKLAWTHQNYGAYVVDDSQDPGSWDVHRLNVQQEVLTEFPQIDTYPGIDSPFGRDLSKIFVRLAVVDNNAPGSIGGGGTPRQALAPAFGS